MKAQETANGPALTYKGTTVIFASGAERPWLVFGDSIVPIEYPERFGQWHTRAWRENFMRRFVDGNVSEPEIAPVPRMYRD